MTRLYTESKKKIFALVVMTALMSIFVGCFAERDEDIALFLRVGTYTGTTTGDNPMNIEAILSTTYNGGNIHFDLGPNSYDIKLTKNEMTSTDTRLAITYPIDITIVFDSSKKPTGAIATFQYTGLQKVALSKSSL